MAQYLQNILKGLKDGLKSASEVKNRQILVLLSPVDFMLWSQEMGL